jgi:hypothetical protein
VPCSYLVVVAASEPALCRYLEGCFRADARTRVIADRRRGGRGAAPAADGLTDRRTRRVEICSSREVAVVRIKEEARTMEPVGNVDDRDALQARLEAAERDNVRLRHELGEARHAMAELTAELDFLRGERAGVALTFGSIVQQLVALQKPISEVSRRLHAGTPAPGDVRL